MCDSASSSADRIRFGTIGGGPRGDPFGCRRLPMTLPLPRASPLTLFAFLPPISILPLFENSTCPGTVKSSKLPVGISVSMLIDGACIVSEKLRCSAFGRRGSLFAGGALLGIGLSSWTETLGMLGERRMLKFESISVSKVVRLSLVVELEGARPESLRTSSCSLDLAA